MTGHADDRGNGEHADGWIGDVRRERRAPATTTLHGHVSAEAMQAAMDERAMRFVEEDKGEFGGQPLEYTMTADGYKQFDVTAEIVDWEVEPGKVVQAWTYNGVVPAPEIHVEVGDKVRVVLHNELPTGTVIHWHGIRVPELDGRRASLHAAGGDAGRVVHLRVRGARAGGRHLPLAQRREPGARRAVRRLHDRRDGRHRRSCSSRASPPTPDSDDQHGAQRRRRDRPVAQRQELPRHAGLHRQGRRHGDGQLLQRGSAGPPDAPPPAAGVDHRQGRQGAARCRSPATRSTSPPASATR